MATYLLEVCGVDVPGREETSANGSTHPMITGQTPLSVVYLCNSGCRIH